MKPSPFFPSFELAWRIISRFTFQIIYKSKAPFQQERQEVISSRHSPQNIKYTPQDSGERCRIPLFIIIAEKIQPEEENIDCVYTQSRTTVILVSSLLLLYIFFLSKLFIYLLSPTRQQFQLSTSLLLHFSFYSCCEIFYCVCRL